MLVPILVWCDSICGRADLHSMVLCAQVCLDTLSVGRSTGVDVLSSLVGTNERDGLDSWFIQDEVDGVNGSVDDVENSWWETSLLGEFGNDHGGSWISLRGLHDETVASDGGEWETPERNHGREVEGADGCNNSQWLLVGSGFHIS